MAICTEKERGGDGMQEMYFVFSSGKKCNGLNDSMIKINEPGFNKIDKKRKHIYLCKSNAVLLPDSQLSSDIPCRERDMRHEYSNVPHQALQNEIRLV